MRIVFTCGGKCGQIYSMIALFNEFKRQDIDNKNQYAFICSDSGLEERALTKEGIKEIIIIKTKEGADTKYARISVSKIKDVLVKANPALVISCGGFPANEVIKKSAKLDIPFALMENELHSCAEDEKLYKKAKKVVLANEYIKNYISSDSNVVVTGAPSRIKPIKKSRADIVRSFGFNPKEKIIAVMGGTGDFDRVNEVMLELIKGTMFKHQIIWAVGKDNVNSENIDKIRMLSDKIHVVRYFENIEEILTIADLVISRSGAMTVQEIKHFSVPALLIPHIEKDNTLQYANAVELKKLNTAQVIMEKSVNKYILVQIINDMLNETHTQHVKDIYKRVDNNNNNQKIYEEIMGSIF